MVDARVVALLDLIDQLPAASRTRHAIVNHPVMAREIAETPEAQDPGEWVPGWDWSAPAPSMLAHLFDLYVSAHSDGAPTKFPRPASLVPEYVRAIETESAAEFFGSLVFADS